MGRPAHGPGSTFPSEVKERLLHLRKLHPGWGPDTLLTALEMDPGFATAPLPSRAQLARLLKHAGLTRRYQPHHALMQPAQSLLTDPHQEWQMDAQGVMRVDGVGKVSLISIVDVTSRLKAKSYPLVFPLFPSSAHIVNQHGCYPFLVDKPTRESHRA